VRLSNGYSLLNPCERATLTELSGGLQPPDAIRVLFLVQQRAKPVALVALAAAFGVFRWLQVTGFNANVRNVLFDFLCSLLFNFL